MGKLSKNRRAPVNSFIQDGGLDAHNRNKQIEKRSVARQTGRKDIMLKLLRNLLVAELTTKAGTTSEAVWRDWSKKTVGNYRIINCSYSESCS